MDFQLPQRRLAASNSPGILVFFPVMMTVCES